MVVYGFRCEACGEFEARFSLGNAPASCACPHCDSPAFRVYHVAHLRNSVPAPLAAALQREEASRDHPEVVRSVPR
ncbi:putative FmdB family regulatory protein [Halopolyspora algeriensis]|nr:putative FmdB family regulatory protein [Halopolyspora algeriensis]